MATYIESGLCLNLPDGQHFRFADLPAYQALKGQHLKEMDFAWVSQGTLFLLEVRSYAQITEILTGADFLPTQGQSSPHRYQMLIDKVTDSLLMMLAAWANSSLGQSLKFSLPVEARARLPLKLVIAVDLPANLVVHLQALKDSLNERLRGRLALADVRNVVVIDYARLVTNPMFCGLIKIQSH
jgi:hypothetical protein